MDPRRSPAGVLNDHPEDQFPNLLPYQTTKIETFKPLGQQLEPGPSQQWPLTRDAPVRTSFQLEPEVLAI